MKARKGRGTETIGRRCKLRGEIPDRKELSRHYYTDGQILEGDVKALAYEDGTILFGEVWTVPLILGSR